MENKMKRVCHKSMIHPLYLLKFSELIFIQNIGGIGIISSSEKHLIAFLDYENPYSCFSKFSPCGFIPAKTTLARALMPRQPYSVAVKSDRRSGYIPCPFGKGEGLGVG